MARQVSIDGDIVTIESQIIEEKNRNDELETTIITIKNSDRLEPYDVGIDCIITENAIAEFFIVANDSVVLTQRDPRAYTHTLTLIEDLKTLERITMSSLQYSQRLDETTYTLLDVCDRALKLIELEETANLGSNRVYDIDGVGVRDANDNYIVGNLTGLALELYERKAPDLQFNTPTLTEIFEEVFLILDGRPRVIGQTTIGIKYYNKKNNEIDIADADEITGNQSIEKFAQKYDIYMENAISENDLNKQAIVYPSANGWASVRSTETELTTKNFLMQVPDKISRVLKFEILADVEVIYIEGVAEQSTFSGIIEVDMTEWLFSKTAWDSLDYEYQNSISITGNTWWNTISRISALYFRDNVIDGFQQDLEIFGSTLFGDTNTWNAFISTATYQGGFIPTGITAMGLGQGLDSSFNTNVREFMFRLTYVPEQTIRVQIEKSNEGAVGTLFANQTERVVDSELLASNLQNKLNREGNKELIFTKRVNSFFDAYQVGDYYEDYIVTKVNNDRQIQYTKSTATLSKNYAVRSGRINIANKPKPFDISNINTIRNDVINHYINVTTFEETKDSYVTTDGINKYIDTFRGIGGFPAEVADVVMSENLLLPCVSQGLASVIHFRFGFEDNVVAGARIELLNNIYGNEFIRYTDDDGRFETIQFDITSGFTPTPDTFSVRSAVAQDLPLKRSGSITDGDVYVSSNELAIYKDGGESYNMSYQLTTVSDNANIFVGNRLSTNNALVVNQTEQLYFYNSDDPIEFGQRLDDGLARLKIVLGTTANPTEIGVQDTLTFFEEFLFFTSNFPSDKNYAIANDNRDVYLIVNIPNQQSLVFNAKENR